MARRAVVSFRRCLDTSAAVLGVVLVYSVLRPVFGVGHQLTVGALAWIFHTLVASDAWQPIVGLIGLDPIYVGAAIRAAGGVQVAGFAVAGPLGGVLHQWLPGVCLGAEHVAGRAAFSMVASPGAPALGRGLSVFGADVIWLAVGVWLFWRWRYRDWRVALLGLLIQAQVGVHHLFEARVNLADIDASGLPFALQLVLPGGGWFTTDLAAMPGGERDLLIGGSLLVLGYASAALVAGIATGLATGAGHGAGHGPGHGPAAPGPSTGRLAWQASARGHRATAIGQDELVDRSDQPGRGAGYHLVAHRRACGRSFKLAGKSGFDDGWCPTLWRYQ